MRTAAVEKKMASAKAKHPTELIRKIQKGLRFSELETLQNSIDLPFEQLAAKLCDLKVHFAAAQSGGAIVAR